MLVELGQTRNIIGQCIDNSLKFNQIMLEVGTERNKKKNAQKISQNIKSSKSKDP